ncbi:recombination protein RecT [Klenkia sp. LSe6-5]|uniref:Recombination protein RecT n=1 Tax=Klenkia sesuvii TaxID=3103137 RepID=A0ABU8E1E0_9ACTN
MGENLRGRVAARAGQQQPGTDVAERKAPPGLVDQVRQMEQQFQMAMPKGQEAAQLVRDVITAISQNPKLRECVPATVLGGAMTMAQLGLRPGVLGHGWLLPFWDSRHDNGNGRKGAFKAQLVIGYQGLVELVHRSDRVISIAARTVYTNDEFALGYGLEGDTFTHNPALDGDRGEPRLYYAIARMKGGGYALTEPMSHTAMEAYRDQYAMAKTREGVVVGPWRDQFEGMAHKTMIRRLVKLLPKSTELAHAIEADEKIRVDLTPAGIDHGQDVIDGEVIDEVPDGVDPATGETTAPAAAEQPAGGEQ